MFVNFLLFLFLNQIKINNKRSWCILKGVKLNDYSRKLNLMRMNKPLTLEHTLLFFVLSLHLINQNKKLFLNLNTTGFSCCSLLSFFYFFLGALKYSSEVDKFFQILFNKSHIFVVFILNKVLMANIQKSSVCKTS